jgi:hypothetical protein
MTVIAFSTATAPDWRWRIVNYAGETIAESPETFGTIAAAVTAGTSHLSSLHLTDLSVPRSPYRASPRHR